MDYCSNCSGGSDGGICVDCMRNRITELEEALEKYGNHMEFCSLPELAKFHSKCNCGYDKALSGKDCDD